MKGLQACAKGGADQKAPPAGGDAPHYCVPPQIFRLWHMPELKGLKRDDRSSKGNQSFGNNLNALVTDLQWYFFSVFTFHCSLYQTNVNKICSENSCKKIYVLIHNNPIIRTLWKFSLNFQIYVMYNLKNQACNNY